jgi:4-amino-4-deoxy-L-arabinose transferase-like glycosyltransferase
MTGLAARNGGRIGLAALIVILLLGLGLRVDYAWEGRAPVFDAVAYERIAANLERGEGFILGGDATQPASNYSPGLPLLVGGLYGLSGGAHERLARLALALLGALAVLFAYLIGRRLSGATAGLIGAGLVAIYPALLEYQGMLMGEPLAATLLAGAVLAMLWASDRSADIRWLVPGALFGALALVRPEYLGISLVLAVVALAWNRDDWRVGAARAAILLAGVALVVAPWTVRNAVVLDRFVPVSTGGGQVLFAGSYLPSGGDPERVGAEVLERHPGLARQGPSDARLEQILAALAAQRYPEMETDEALGRMGRERLWDGLSERPLEYGGFVAEKLWRAWSRGPRQVMERPGWEALHWALVGFGLLGLAVLVRRRPREALLLAVLLVSVSAIVALLVASPRRVLVTIPIVAALAGVGAMACADSLARRWRR